MLFCQSLARTFILFSVLCAYWAPLAAASQLPSHTQLQAKAEAALLYQSKYWHALVHYYPSSRADTNGVESHVDDARFFLAEDGKYNPQAEMKATISALFGTETSTESADVNSDVRCRFVAREKWLRGQLSLPEASVPAHCSEYVNWRGNIGRGSVTLVFPASYLNSPSSMFGHTLLRFDPVDMQNDSPLLSWSLNFAADVGDETMSAGYALKGLAGGYPGRFNSIPYFEKLQEYGAIENRDIWEYQLDLKPEEIDRMLDHAWELREISFDYFFFRENCSFRLLELIDLARPGLTLTSQFPRTAIPADTVKAVNNAGIVSRVEYRASLGTRLNHAIDAVPATHRHWIEQVEQSPQITQHKAFMMLDAQLQATIIRTANELLTFRSRRAQRNAETAERRLALLTLVSQLPQEKPPTVTRPPRPESGHDTTTVSLSYGQQTDIAFTEAALRFSYHDVLDRQTGYSKGAGIVLGDIRIRSDNTDNVRLQAFELVRLQSFNDRYSQLNSLSWEIMAGLARNPVLEDNRLSATFEGSVGKSLRLGNTRIGYLMPGLSVNQFINPGKSYVNAHLRTGIIAYSRFGASRLQLSANAYQSRSLQTTLSLQHNYPITKNHAIRLSAEANRIKQADSEHYSIAYRWYF